MLNKYSKILSDDEIKVKEYISKYIDELQRHFDLPDYKMREIVYKVYKDLSPFKFLKDFIKNAINMIKSEYNIIVKKRN